MFETNVFGVAVMTATFLPLLRASKYHDRRIGNVTSGLGQIDIAYSPPSEYNAKMWELPVYRSSKSAINMISAVDDVSLEKENILTFSLPHASVAPTSGVAKGSNQQRGSAHCASCY